MKKLLSLMLAFALILSLGVLFINAEEGDADEDEGPSSYLWLKAESQDSAPHISFKVDGSKFQNKTYKVRAYVYFSEDINAESDGVVYVNYYSYYDDTKYNDFSYLINFKDFASQKEEGASIGAWAEYSFEFNPYEVTYGGGTNVQKTGTTANQVGMVTVGIGFWHATGTIKVSSILISDDGGTPVWSRGFSTGLDPETDAEIVSSNMTSENKGTAWDVVVPEAGSKGNLAKNATATYPAGFGAYTASLNDGVALDQGAYTGDWYSFYYNPSNPDAQNTERLTIEGTEYSVGTVVFDFGTVKNWNQVRVNVWDGNGTSGIASPDMILVSYSDNGTDWTEAGDLLLGDPGTIYWAEKDFESTASRYVKVQICWKANGVFLMINEIEIIEADFIDIDESEDESKTSTPTSQSETSQGGTAPTGDNGLVALAIISVIALAGAVVVKRR